MPCSPRLTCHTHRDGKDAFAGGWTGGDSAHGAQDPMGAASARGDTLAPLVTGPLQPLEEGLHHGVQPLHPVGWHQSNGVQPLHPVRWH